MKQLLLVRHAIALDRDEAMARGISDANRPLTDKGEARMQRIAQVLQQQLPRVGQLLCSPYLRTRQTAAILAEAWQCTLSSCEALQPGSDPQLLLAQLSCNSMDPIVLVGHEPDLSELLGLLLCGQPRSFVRMKKGGAALLRLDDKPSPGSAELQWQMNPKQLLGLD